MREIQSSLFHQFHRKNVSFNLFDTLTWLISFPWFPCTKWGVSNPNFPLLPPPPPPYLFSADVFLWGVLKKMLNMYMSVCVCRKPAIWVLIRNKLDGATHRNIPTRSLFYFSVPSWSDISENIIFYLQVVSNFWRMSSQKESSEYEIQYRSTIQPRTAVRSQSRQSGNYVSGGNGAASGG